MFIARLVVPRICCLFVGVFSCVTLTDFVSIARAQEVGIDEELAKQQKIVDRFLTVLEKNPRRGTALDRVYGFHVESGTLDALIQRFQERTVKNPQDGVAWMILGLIESQRGRDAAAVDAFSKATTASANDPLPAYYLGQSQVLVGQPDQAVKAFELALSRKPAQADLLEIFQALGRVHQRAQRTQEALEVWARLEKLFPNDARVQEQIAAVLADENQSALALPRYEKLVQLTKDDYRKAVYRIEAAELKVKLNRSQEAIGDLEKLLATLNPSSWLHREVRRKIDDVFLRTDDQDGLAKYYLASVTKNGEDVDGMARLARILARQGRVPEAQVWLDKALKLAPTRKELRQTFIEQLVEDQRYTEAITQYELLDKAEPNNPDILREWGKLILRETGKPKEERLKLAEKVWRRLLLAKPKDPLIATQVADLFRHSEMTAGALELYQKAVALAPNEPQYLEYLGEYYHQLKRDEEALSTWKKITEGKKRTATNLARLAEVLSSFGYLKQAIPEIQAACVLEPKDLALHVKAADLLTKDEQYPVALLELSKAESLAQNAEESELILSAQLKVYQLEDSLARRAAELDKETQGAQPTAKQLFLLARYQEALRKYSEATHAIDAAVKQQPQSIPFLSAAARIYEQAGDLKSAVDLNQKLALVDRRGRSDYLKYIAQLEMQLGQTNEALQAGRDLIATAPANSESYEFYANLCFRLGKGDEGLLTLRRAVRLNPNDPKVALILAESLAGQYRTEEAIELYWQSYDRSTVLDEKLNQIQKLTDLYLQTNHLDKLLERIERIRRDAEDKRESTICLSQAYSSAGDYGMARKELESLLTENTRDTQLLMQLSKLSTTEGDLISAVKYQQQLAKLAPGPETEQPLATLLAQTGAVQESTAIMVRLASKEQDAEKFLRGVDMLLSSGQAETALQLTEDRLREEPLNWELIYREGAVLAKKEPEAAARRFRTILEFHNDDDSPGIALKTRLAKASKSGANSGRSVTLQYAPGMAARIQSGVLSQIRFAAGLSQQNYYGRQTAIWTPDDFGQARLAAMAWLFRFSRDAKKADEFLKRYPIPAQNQAVTPQAIWDSVCVAAFAANDSDVYLNQPEVKRAIQRLAEAGDASAESLLLTNLESRFAQPQGRGGSDATIAPLTDAEIALMLKAFNNLRKRGPGTHPSPRSTIPVTIVLSELKRAGKVDEEKKLYQSIIDDAHSTIELSQAVAASAHRKDVPNTLRMFDKWSIASRQEAAKKNDLEFPFAIVELMGVIGMEKQTAECMLLLDHYLDHHQAITNIGRQSIASATRGNRSTTRDSGIIYYYYGKTRSYIRTGFPAPGTYYNTHALSVLRTVYEVFHRHDLLSDLQKHLEQRLDQAIAGDKVYGHLALAYFHGWSDQKEISVEQLLSATQLVPQDWKLKLDVAQLQAELQNFDEALEIVDSITPVDQDSMREREFIALNLAVRLGDRLRARQSLERLFGLRLDAAIQIELARQMRQLGMSEQAESVMSRVQRQSGSQLGSLVTLMNAHLGQGKNDVAAQIAFQILRRTRSPLVASFTSSNTNDEYLRSAALQVLRSTGKLKQIIATTEDQLKRTTVSGALLATLSEYYQAAGDQKKAVELEQKLLESRPDDVNLRVRYAKKLAATGKAAESCQQFEIAIRAQPTIIRSEFSDISSVFQGAKKEAEFVKLLNELDLKVLGHYSYATSLAASLLRTKESQPTAIALLERAWEAFPESRGEMLGILNYDQTIWAVPRFYQFGKQSLLPVESQAKTDPWYGFGRVRSTSARGNATSIVRQVFDAAAKQNLLRELRDELAECSKNAPSWKAGPLLVALADARMGNIDTACPVVERLANISDAVEFPSEVRWIAAQELESSEELRPFVVKFYQGALEPTVATPYREFGFGPALRLLDLYLEMGRVDDAKNLLAAAEKQRIGDNYDPMYAASRKIANLLSIAQEYEKIKCPLDAMRLYRQVATDPILNDPAFKTYMGAPEQYVKQANSKWAGLIAKLARSPDFDLSSMLLVPSELPDQPVLDLMLAFRVGGDGNESSTLPKLTSPLANLLKSQIKSPSALGGMRQRLQELKQKRPDDFSIRIVAAYIEACAENPGPNVQAIVDLKSLAESVPLEKLRPGQRANARQREFAMQQIGIWLVALECLKQPALRAEGEALAMRALEAAQYQLSTQYSIAMLSEGAELFVKQKDSPAAEKYLTGLLEIACNRPQVRKSTGAVAGDATVPPAKKESAVTPAPIPGTAVRQIPPLTQVQFRQAMTVAEIAAEHQLRTLAARAMRESLTGGLPVAESVSTSGTVSMSGARMIKSASGVRFPDSGQADTSAMSLVGERFLTVSKIWRSKGYPAQEIYAIVHEIVFPISRPGEIVLYEEPLADWDEPQSLGRELVRWATVSKQTDALKKEIAARQSLPSAVLRGNVLLVQLAIEAKNNAAAVQPLKQLDQIVREQPRVDVMAVVAHAAGLAAQQPDLTDKTAQILDETIKVYSKQNADQADQATKLLAKHYVKTKRFDALRSMFEAQLEAKAIQARGYNPDYQLFSQRTDLANLVAANAPSHDLPLLLEYYGRMVDTPISQRYVNNFRSNVPLWHLTWQLQAVDAAKRYALLKEWTLPKESRQSVRYSRGFLTGLQIPQSFLSPEEASLGAPPSMGLTSNFSLLIQAAKEVDKLDELQAAVDRAAIEKLPLAEGLSVLVAIARGDTIAEAKIKTLIDASQQRKQNPVNEERQSLGFSDARWLDMEVAVAARENERTLESGWKLASALLHEDQAIYFNARLPFIQRILAEGTASHLTPQESEQFRGPNLRLWNPGTPPEHTSSTNPPVWWSAQDGHLSHLSGFATDSLFFRYPLAGSFEFSFEEYSGFYSDAKFGFGGLLIEPEFWTRQATISPASLHENVKRGSSLSVGDHWNRYSVRVNPQSIRFYVNNHLLYEEQQAAATSPWFAVYGLSTWRSSLRNFKLTGEVTIPRKVTLIQGDQIEGWIAAEGESLPPRLSLRESKDQQQEAEDAEQETPKFDWHAEDGVLLGRYDASWTKSTPGHIRYHRPMQDGDVLKYEFFYEAGRTHVHPAMGPLGLVLEPEGVRLRWLTDYAGSNFWDRSNFIDELQNRRGPATLPLKSGEWNEIEMSLSGGILSLKLNAELVLERPLESTNPRQFGLFHFRGQTAARVRNVVLTGNWPEKLTAEEFANLLIPENPNEGLNLKRARHLAAREENIVADVYRVAMEARAMPSEQRYEKLRDWVLPSPTHATIRLQAGFSPTDPPVVVAKEAVSGLKGRRQHLVGEMVAPVRELVNTAVELQRLDELEQAVQVAEKQGAGPLRDIQTLRVLIAIARNDDVTAAVELKGLIESLGSLDPATPLHERYAELIAIDAALDRPALRKEIVPLTEFYVVGNRQQSWWDYRLRALRSKALWLDSQATVNLPRYQQPPNLTQWTVVSHPTAEYRAKGLPPAIWRSAKGQAEFMTGNGDDAIYFQSPLTGNFELRMRRTTFWWREMRAAYGGLGVDIQYDGQSIWRCLQGRGNVKQIPLKIEPWTPEVDYRLVVQDGQYTSFVNDKQVYTEKLGQNPDPWLTIQTAQFHYDGKVQHVQITGSPKVPDVINLSAAPSLTSWRSTYYGETIDEPQAVWKKDHDEIVGALLQNSAGSQQQSVLQYHRPLLEDGEIQYDFFYEAGKTEIHPAMDRAAFLLTPTGIQLHYLTDAAYDRSGLSPDNSRPLPDSASVIPLKEKAWNTLKLALAGDLVTLTLNGEKVGSYQLESINQRIFGLFRYRSETAARVKNVTHRGNWPTEVPAVAQQELAASKPTD